MNNAYKRELVKLLVGIKDTRLMRDFLEDLFSPAEFNDIVKRWQLVKQLAAEVSQRAIAAHLQVGVAKITRGSRMLLNKHGGFNKVLRKLKNK